MQSTAVSLVFLYLRTTPFGLLISNACYAVHFRYPFNAKQEIVEPDWEVYLRETGQKMVSEQSPKALLEVRGRIYELLSHCIAPEMIIKVKLILLTIRHHNFINFFHSFFLLFFPETAWRNFKKL